MVLIDANKFLLYLIYSKHIDGLTCGEVKKAIEMCKVDIFDKIKSEITGITINGQADEHTSFIMTGEQVKQMVLDIIDKYDSKSEEPDADSD